MSVSELFAAYGIFGVVTSAKKFKFMKTDQFSSMNDIIFEKRNKRYGAYELRKNYHRRLFKSFAVASVSLITVFLFSRISKQTASLTILPITDSVYISDPFIVEQFTAPKAPEHFNPPPKQSAPDEQAYVPVTDSIPEEVDTASHSTTDTQLADEGNFTGSGTTNDTTGKNSSLNTGLLSPDSVHRLTSLDVQPDFPGGLDKFYAYLKSKIRYTHSALGEDVKGRMYAKFIVDEEGYIRNVTIVKRLGYGLDEQVSKVLEESPKWNPGIVRNTAVKTELILPVNFNLQ